MNNISMSSKGKSIKSDSDEIWVTDFDQEEALKFREKVIAQSQEDPNQPIIININSYGGFVDSLAMMIETLDEVPNPIVTVVKGCAMSCGAVLLSHGDVRWCGKHSRVMVHEVSGGSVGDVHDVHSDAIEIKRLNKWFLGLLAENCGIAGGYDGLRKLIKSKDGRNIYMSANDALDFGIVDAIGIPRVGSHTVHEIATVPTKNLTILPQSVQQKTKPIRKNKRRSSKNV